MNVLNGREISKKLIEKYAAASQRLLKEYNIVPKLVAITVGDDPASKIYVGQKEKKARLAGFDFDWIVLQESTTQAELNARITECNEDNSVNGIIVQLPLPAHLNPQEVMNLISVEKDVDGFHVMTMGKVVKNLAQLYPCTPKGVLHLLNETAIELKGKTVTIVGASQIVGLPLAIMMMNQGATVSVCNIDTPDKSIYTKNADIIVMAAGVPNLLRGHEVKEGVIVIDVGINRLADKTIVGDVNYDEVQAKASYITPVPGGVGPMTVAMLMEQTLICTLLQHQLEVSHYI